MLFDGFRDFVLKEKLKGMKSALREWHQKHGSNNGFQLKSTKESINLLDLVSEYMSFDENKVMGRHFLSSQLFSLARCHCSMITLHHMDNFYCF